MHQEAAEAAEAVARLLMANRAAVRSLAGELRAQPPRAVVTCARGSSDHAATFAKYLIETSAGVLTSSAAMSVSSVYEARQDLDGVLFLAISQSGRSPDLLASVRAARDAGARVVAMVNDETAPLAELAHTTLPLHAGPERSVAATKSFITALAAIAQLVAAWTEDAELEAALDALPEQLSQAWSLDWPEVVANLLEAQSLYVLGRGVGFAVAQEAALKFKETCGLHAEGFSAAEVLHGPMALVERGFPLLVFTQDDPTRDSVIALADQLRQRGAEVMLAATDAPGALPAVSAHPTLQPILQIQSFYKAVNALSVARGLDPDNPPHLRKVTETV
ncbi:SIS domain-containing protein [Phenylobacterium deserti]|uniref:Iron dicitrate transport regulator FecR n=1 Tax=Phenylobacterium deserti TaxID=1914756 RepID=A0A328ADZ4_9CAUL|nr:SIS domain-containing protein [Phenylobacterium deserti]RAK52869.1 iron dicitrate transport regulator FecR [Phenylobacterium deserti]